MLYIRLFCITVIVCFIVDCSGVVVEIRKAVARFLSKRSGVNVDYKDIPFKPFSCSLCSVWWTCLAYILFTGNFTVVNIAVVAVFSLLASNISGFLMLFKDFLSSIETKFSMKMKF